MTSLPATELKRLKARETANRRRAKEKGAPAIEINIEALWELQGGMCWCPECRGERALNPNAKHGDPDHIIIAHPFCLSAKGSLGHVPNNVELWRAECNKREARMETGDVAKSKRMAFVNCIGAEKPEKKTKWPKGRGFPPKGSQKFQSRKVMK